MGQIWMWTALPTSMQRGLQHSTIVTLGPFSEWLQRQIVSRRRCQDYADLGQNLCLELRRMVGTVGGRRLLRSAKSLPALLATITERLRVAAVRARQAEDKALRDLSRVGQASSPDPAKTAEQAEIGERVARAILTLAPSTRTALAAASRGTSLRKIARLLWRRADKGGVHRAANLLYRARADLLAALLRFGIDVRSMIKKNEPANRGPGRTCDSTEKTCDSGPFRPT